MIFGFLDFSPLTGKRSVLLDKIYVRHAPPSFDTDFKFLMVMFEVSNDIKVWMEGVTMQGTGTWVNATAIAQFRGTQLHALGTSPSLDAVWLKIRSLSELSAMHACTMATLWSAFK